MWLNGFTMVACFGFRLCRWRALLSILYEFRDGTLTRCGSEPMKVFRSCFAASFYLPSKCVRYFWLRLWHSTSSMKLHFVHFLPMLTLPWRNSRALIVTDANTRSFLLKGSCEHAHRLHSFIKNKSLSTNLNRKLPRLSDLCFYKLHYTDSKLLPRRTSFSMFYRRHRHDSCSRFTRVRCNVCYSHSFINLFIFYYQSIFIIENIFLKN